MITTRLSSGQAAFAAAVFCLAATSAANATDNGLGPFVVGEQGEFFAGGVYEDASGSIVSPPYPTTGELDHMAGQMYVFYQLPAGVAGWSWKRSGKVPDHHDPWLATDRRQLPRHA